MEKIYIKEKLEKLVPYEFNNKKHSKKQIDLIINSIKENEYINPIIIDENNIILSGHGRLEALKQLGYKETEVIKVEGLTENQKKKYRILDNRLADLAEYDLENLKIDLEELEDNSLNELFKEYFKEGGDTKYTKKVEAPIYKIQGLDVGVEDLIENKKEVEVYIKEIEDLDIDENKKEFLKLAASRLYKFNYENIAEFYSKQDVLLQETFEKLFLVIIDFNKAIELGYVNISENILENYIDNDE